MRGFENGPVSPEGPIDFSNKSGRLMGAIRAAIAGLERTEILERVWSAKEEKRRRGELAQNPIVLHQRHSEARCTLRRLDDSFQPHIARFHPLLHAGGQHRLPRLCVR